MAVSVASPLEVAELRQFLSVADPAALLVPPRLLRRVIKHDRQVSGLGARTPHSKNYFIGREALLELADRAELEVPPDRDLPATLILIAAPDPDRLRELPRDKALIKCWRLLFHARVHVVVAARRLSAAAVRARIDAIGQAEFSEIRTVLRQERYLLPPRDDATAYEEFAALFCELRLFRPALVAHYFPAVDEPEHIDRILNQDVDAVALFTATRLAGAPDPDPSTIDPDKFQDDDRDCLSENSELPRAADVPSLIARADQDAAKGNHVRAAIRRFQAAHAAPPDQPGLSQVNAQADVEQLVRRLGHALHRDEATATSWTASLMTLLPRAAHGFWEPEARLLYDLQKICVDHERPIYAVDVIEWAYAGFRGPLVQPLPTQPLVRAVKHLRGAVNRLPVIRVSTEQRKTLSRLLHDALHHSEAAVRARLRSVLSDTLQSVGMRPTDFPEQVSLAKLTEELLDRVIQRGFINLGDLRDALSRNEVKLGDLSGPIELLAGDPLLRANRALAANAAGTYRRGEIYLRGLQRGSSLLFGTRPGRWLTLFVLMPFLGAFATLVFVHEIAQLARLAEHMPWVHAETVADPSLEELLEALGEDYVAAPAKHHPAIDWAKLGLASLPLGVFFLLLMHSAEWRRWVGTALRLTWRCLRALAYDFPTAVVYWPPLVGFFTSRPVVIFARYVIKPLPAALLAGLGAWFAGFGSAGAVSAGLLGWAAASLFLNSRLGRDLEEIAADWTMAHWEYVYSFVPGLIRLVLEVFHVLLEGLDRVIYEVDEWLRFRHGEGRLTLAAKIVFGYVWFLITYVIRLFINVLIEPTINPIKHFPAVTVAAKLLVPFWIPLTEFMATPIMFLGRPLAYSIAFFVLHALPGAAGFLVWELKENWRLYRANRRTNLGPVVIGSHGETMARLLRPGFHSGTLPKLHAKLRRAERWIQRGGSPSKSHRLREELHHVEESLAHFAERELLAFINGDKSWPHGPVRVAELKAGSNRVRLTLACPALSKDVVILFEEHAGWLCAGIAEPAWLPCLDLPSATVFETAIVGFYKKAGVDLIDEQIAACLGAPRPRYAVSDAGMVVWPQPDYETEVAYDLTSDRSLQPRCVSGPPAELLSLAADQAIFRRQLVTWSDWVEAWDHSRVESRCCKIGIFNRGARS